MTSKKNTSFAPAGQQRSLRSLGGHGWQPRMLALTLAALFAPVGGFAQDSTAVEETTTLPGISVVGTSGTDNVRQAQRRVQVGPLGEHDSVVTPYSVSAVSAEQMADDQNFSVQDALRYLPWVQADTIRPQTRGVQGSVIQNSRVDGFNMVSTTNYPTEQFERIEVLNGVAGSLYGPATGSGVFGFTQKRAGTTGTNTLRLGIDSDARPSIHADLWTPLTADKRWRVRANLLQETGESYVEGSHRQRRDERGRFSGKPDDLSERTIKRKTAPAGAVFLGRCHVSRMKVLRGGPCKPGRAHMQSGPEGPEGCTLHRALSVVWPARPCRPECHSTVTDLARLRGLSTSVPRARAAW